jgi:hypothetical protein
VIAPRLDKKERDEIVKAVLIAAGGALVSKLIEWGVDALKERVRGQKADDK